MKKPAIISSRKPLSKRTKKRDNVTGVHDLGLSGTGTLEPRQELPKED